MDWLKLKMDTKCMAPYNTNNKKNKNNYVIFVCMGIGQNQTNVNKKRLKCENSLTPIIFFFNFNM